MFGKHYYILTNKQSLRLVLLLAAQVIFHFLYLNDLDMKNGLLILFKLRYGFLTVSSFSHFHPIIVFCSQH